MIALKPQAAAHQFSKSVTSVLAAAVFCLVSSGCSSGPVMIAPKISASAQRLGEVEGSGVGGLGLAGTAYNFIPMGLNSRYERAYNEALSKAEGAKALTNVTIEETWFWLGIGTFRHVKITGDAVK